MIDIIRKYGVGIIIILVSAYLISLALYLAAPNGKNKYQDVDDVLVLNAENVEASNPNLEFLTPKVRPPTAEEAEKYPQFTNLPTLYITIESSLSKIQRGVYINGRYTLVDENGNGIYDELLMIKGRGNYQWGMPKKPYTLKLAKETSLLGMKSARTWLILGEYIDKTLLRNYLTFSLSKTAGLYTLDSRFIDVYFNGKYHGNYFMTESIQIHKNRIDIDPDTEAIFEIEAIYRHGDHEYCVKMIDDNHHIMYSEPDNIDDELKLANLENFKNFFKKMQDSLSKGYSEYSKYIDVDSFINWYLVNEFCKNFDSGFTSSCYCYLKDGKLYMGPVWDYHTCYGSQNVATCMNPVGFHGAESPWYGRLLKDATFARKLRERWTQLRDDGTFDDLVKSIDNTINHMSASITANFELWPGALKDNGLRGGQSKYTFDEEVDYLKNWIDKRISWLDGEWYGK
jgi:spore coat protein CotH